MLEIKNIYKTFNPGTINEKVALNGISLKLEEGDFVTVIGGNGAGKSVAQEQHRGREVPRQPGTAVHRGDADGVVAGIPATGDVQFRQSLRQTTEKGRKLYAA